MEQLKTNKEYVGSLISYFGNQVSSMKSHEIPVVLGNTRKYVEDTCAQIADIIIGISNDLESFLEVQSTELDSLSRRVHGIATRLSAHEHTIAQAFSAEHVSARVQPPRRLKVRRLAANELAFSSQVHTNVVFLLCSCFFRALLFNVPKGSASRFSSGGSERSRCSGG